MDGMTTGQDAFAPVLEALRTACGPDAVATDPEECAFFGADVYATGAVAMAVVRPATVEALCAAVRIAAAAGLAVHPRGGGMSYTDAFLPGSAAAIVLDTAGLDRIVAIQETDLWATVEAGVTWAQLDAALAPKGLRARFWGPMSGATATIGGGMSHGAATFGSAKAGMSGATALGFDVVLADGTLSRTGMDGQPGAEPFLRNYGPDLTGLFAHDGGAFGVKARITLALEPRPALIDGLSFAFADLATTLEAVRRVSRHGLAAEVIVTDAAVMAMNAQTTSLKDGAAMAARVFAQAPDLVTGAVRAAKLALAGRDFARGAAYGAHFTLEAPDRARMKAAREDLRRAMGAAAREMPPTVALAVRAFPFPPLPVTAGDGRRLLALHGLVPFSRAAALDADVQALLAPHRQALEAAKATVMFVFATIGANALLYEPFFYWEDSLSAYHRRRLAPEMLAALPERPDNPAARALVDQLKGALVALFRRHGCAHLQIGRVYPVMQDRDAGAMRLLHALKREADPDGRLNPGVLGL
jgi:FAD/FMN-containing dehydrogenase